MEKGADQNAPHPKKTSLPSVCPVFPRREGSSQNTLQPKSLRASVSSVFSAAGPFLKGKTVTDRHSGQTTNQANIEKHENRFADMESREGGGWMAVEKDKNTNGAETKGAASAQESPEILTSIFLGQILRKQENPENQKSVFRGKVWLAFGGR